MTVTDCLLIIAVCAIGATFCTVQVRRALREPLERDQIAADARRLVCTEPELVTEDTEDEWVYDGPDSLRLLEETDQYLDAYAASYTHLFDRLRDRLRQAVRDEQRKGAAS